MSDPILNLTEDVRCIELSLPSYDARLVPAAIETWRGRMVNEHGSARVFAALSDQLEAAGFDARHAADCRRFAAEERNHGVLCGAVVAALGGAPYQQIAEPAPYPLHLDAPLRAAVLRNVIHICCMSETVAVSLIGEERLQMPDGALRRLLTTIYADEVGHARFGWRLLERVAPTLSEPERAAIERYLPVALAHLEQHELAHLPDRDAPPCGEQLGLCSGRDGRSLFYETVERVIRPGLARWFLC